MIWYVNKRFTIITKVDKKDQPQKIRKMEIIWNDFIDRSPV